MAAQSAFAIGILGVSKTSNDYTVTSIPQPEAAFITEDGIGRVHVVEIPRTGNAGIGVGVEAEWQKLSSKLFVTNDSVAARGTNPAGYSVGLLIVAANGTTKIGPFFGYLDPSGTNKLMNVTVTSPLLKGKISVSVNGTTTVKIGSRDAKVPKLRVTANFDGLLSGVTAVDRDSIPT